MSRTKILIMTAKKFTLHFIIWCLELLKLMSLCSKIPVHRRSSKIISVWMLIDRLEKFSHCRNAKSWMIWHLKGIRFTQSLVYWGFRTCRLTWTVPIVKLWDGEWIFRVFMRWWHPFFSFILCISILFMIKYYLIVVLIVNLYRKCSEDSSTF